MIIKIKCNKEIFLGKKNIIKMKSIKSAYIKEIVMTGKKHLKRIKDKNNIKLI